MVVVGRLVVRVVIGHNGDSVVVKRELERCALRYAFASFRSSDCE